MPRRIPGLRLGAAVALVATALAASMVAPAATPASAATFPAATTLADDVVAYELVPGTDLVVYAEARRDGSTRLFSRPITGGTATPLGRGPAIDVDGSARFAVTPDGSAVVHVRDRAGSDTASLVVVPTTGGPGRTLAELDDNSWFRVTPDSSRVVFATLRGSGVQFHSVPLDGGPVAELGDPVSRWDPDALVITSDSQRLVHRHVLPGAGSSCARSRSTAARRSTSRCPRPPDSR